MSPPAISPQRGEVDSLLTTLLQVGNRPPGVRGSLAPVGTAGAWREPSAHTASRLRSAPLPQSPLGHGQLFPLVVRTSSSRFCAPSSHFLYPRDLRATLQYFANTTVIIT